MAAEDRVRCEGSVREPPPPVPVTARIDEYKASKRRPEAEKGDDYQEGSTEALPLGLWVGGYGFASSARRQAPDAGLAAASMPKALTRSDGEHSDRRAMQESRHGAHSRCRARESLKIVADSGIVPSDPPAEEPEIESYRSPQGRLPGAGHGFLPTISPSCLVF